MLRPWERKKAVMKLDTWEQAQDFGGGDTEEILDASIGQGSKRVGFHRT